MGKEATCPSFNGLVIPIDIAEGQKWDRSPTYNTVFHYHLCRLLTTEIHLKVCVYTITFPRHLYPRSLLFKQSIFAFFNSGAAGFYSWPYVHGETKCYIITRIFVFSGNCIADSKTFWELESSDLQKRSGNFQDIFCSHAWRVWKQDTEAHKITGYLTQFSLNSFSRVSHYFIRHTVLILEILELGSCFILLLFQLIWGFLPHYLLLSFSHLGFLHNNMCRKLI